MRSVLLLVLGAASAAAQSPHSASADLEHFEKNIRPLLVTKCSGCHGEKVKMGGLNLSSPAALQQALTSGIIVRSDPEHSRLYRAVLYTEPVKMPPTGKLPAGDIEALRTWIENGAVLPAASTAPAESAKPVSDGRQHWAFQPIANVTPPEVKQKDWPQTPLDRFILAKLEEKGLTPAPRAAKLALLRRVTLDLTGLPPSLAEIRAFLDDASPDAYAKVVDRLLASRQYSERWGRHWLDVARYADSTGMDEDNLYPHAWRYRDYVIQAFQQDVPFDQFIREQIAGDLLPAKTPEERARNVVATGFLAIGPRPLAQQDRLQMIYDVVDEQIDTTTKAFLGLTVACARCHDHKFDPIPTKDYYGLASIFASTTSFRNQGRPGSISFMHYTPLDQAAYDRYQTHRWHTLSKQAEYEDALAEDTNHENSLLRTKLGEYLAAAWKVRFRNANIGETAAAHDLEPARLERWVRWTEKLDEKHRSGMMKAWFEATEGNIAAVSRSYQEQYVKTAEQWDKKLDSWRVRLAREALQDRDLPARPKFSAEDDPFFAAVTFDGGPMELQESERVRLLKTEWKLLQDTMPPAPALASAVCDGPSIEQRVFVRGSLHSPGDPVTKHFPVVLAGMQQTPVTRGSGRLELANWLASPDNPLTPRVIVNRVWQWHFGEGLMRTPNNWGTTGEKPTHPELLDYLAAQFVKNGWSIKRLHRQILLSSTYQMTSRVPQSVRESDPGNRLWSRFNRLRMSVEQVRDSLLFLDGSIDLEAGGSLLPTGKQKRVSPEDSKRRTVYLPLRRGSLPSLLSTFDFGDATTSSEGRTRTNVAPQALFLMNSQFVLDRARGLAQQLLQNSSTPDAKRVQAAYLIALAREPDAAEVDAALSYIASLESKLHEADAKLTAWTSFCHILAASNEFLYIQ